MSDLEIFKLGISLALALKGDNEAIADVNKLFRIHPEMFKNMEDVVNVIQEVVNDPDFMLKKSEQNIIAVKQLSETRMGDVGIRNEKGTNRIYHANKKRLRDYIRLQKMSADGKDVHTPYTQVQSLDGRLVQKNISSADKPIIPQTLLNNLITSKSINEFAKNLVEIIKVSPDNKLSFYDDIFK